MSKEPAGSGNAGLASEGTTLAFLGCGEDRGSAASALVWILTVMEKLGAGGSGQRSDRRDLRRAAEPSILP